MEISQILQFVPAFKIGYRKAEIAYVMDVETKKWVIETLDGIRTKNCRSIFDYPLLPGVSNSHSYSLEAGNTPIWELKELSKSYPAQVFLKCESENPSGSFKDRETVMSLLAAWEKGEDHLFIYSSGNAACSAAYYAQKNNKKITTIVPGDIYLDKLSYIKELGANVIVLGDKTTVYEEGYEIYQDAMNILFPNNPYKDISVKNFFRNEGSKTIAFELIDQIGKIPDFIIVPTANGSLISGIWKGLTELHEIGYISSLPKMISIGMVGASPLFNEINGPVTDEEPTSEHMVGSTLEALDSYDMHFASRAIKESNGLALTCTWQDIVRAYKTFEQQEASLIKAENIVLEPSAMTPFVALNQLQARGEIGNETNVVLLGTGNGYKSLNLLDAIVDQLPLTKELINNHLTFDHRSDDHSEIRIEKDLNHLLRELQNAVK